MLAFLWTAYGVNFSLTIRPNATAIDIKCQTRHQAAADATVPLIMASSCEPTVLCASTCYCQ